MKQNNMIDEKIIEITKRKGFTNFWEAFDFVTLAGYSEIDALKFCFDLFNGDMWGNIITATYTNKCIQQNVGLRDFYNAIDRNYVWGVDVATQSYSDDLTITLSIMTNEGNPLYIPIYKSYIETSHYENIPELDKCIKTIELTLKTELAINLYKKGLEQMNK